VVDTIQKREAYNSPMRTLHTTQLETLEATLSDLPSDAVAAVLSRPRNNIEFPDGVGADALQAALELAALIR